MPAADAAAGTVHLAAGCVSAWADLGGGGPSSQDERLRLAGISTPARRQQFLAGRRLLRSLLDAVCGPAPHGGWALSAQAGQAPRVGQRPDLCLSLAHSGCHVVAALAVTPVGIDVERLRPRKDLDGLMALACGAAEQAQLAALEPALRPAYFYALWALKEAAFKRRAERVEGLAELVGRSSRPGAPALAEGWTWSVPGAVIALAAAPGSRLRWHGAAPDAAPATWVTADALPPG